MRKIPVHSLLLAFTVGALTLVYLTGLRSVPYHPDESTQIFMSSDVRLFFQNPGALFWQPGRAGDLRQHYREMDAPLTRYLIGAARWIAGLPSQKADWNWSWSWQANQAAGALPDEQSLWVSRLAVAWLFPISLLLVYAIGAQLGGHAAGWAAMLLYAGNGLVLLHTRRAMAESALVTTSLLAMWVMLRWKRHAWLAALPLALAFNAKQSAGVLLLPALVALLWQTGRGWRQLLRSGLLFSAIFLAVTLLLNPFLWQHPAAAALSAWQARADFTTNMAAAITQTGAKLPGNLNEQLSAELYHVFFAAPSIAETGNYTRVTLASESAYFANPLHGLLRGLAGGGLMLAFSLLGILLAGLNLGRARSLNRRPLALMLVITLAQTLILGWIVTIPWQRYYLVSVPIACLWAGFAVADFGRKIAGLIQNHLTTKKVLPND